MVVAKHDAAHEELGRQFEDREIEKEYIALVGASCRRPAASTPHRTGSTTGKDVGSGQQRARRSHDHAAHPSPASRFPVAIDTGRTHQIRVHLSAIGHAIVGDATYGGARARVAADLRPVLSLDRPFLHAYKLALKHPIDGRPMQWEAPLAPDLQHVLNELEALQE